MRKVIPEKAALIPSTASLAFQGVIFDVYQWSQKMFDGSEATFEMLKRADTVQIMGIDKDKIVFILDEQPGRPPQVHVPGGRVDPDDASWLSAAKREMLEETGLEFKNWKLISVEQPIIKIEWFCPVYLATDLSSKTSQKTDEEGEKIEDLYKSFDEAREIVTSGKYPAVSYLTPLFSRVSSFKSLIDSSEFKGQEVDR